MSQPYNMADAKNTKKPNSDIHAFGGFLFVAVDGAFWTANVASMGLATLFTCLGAFLFTGAGVFLVQKYMSEDDTGPALAKGFVVGTLAGVPTPIAGTAGGIYIIGKAGIKKLLGKS